MSVATSMRMGVANATKRVGWFEQVYAMGGGDVVPIHHRHQIVPMCVRFSTYECSNTNVAIAIAKFTKIIIIILTIAITTDIVFGIPSLRWPQWSQSRPRA
eukprot:11154644-Lingulodinium_polyedra.AAC.1